MSKPWVRWRAFVVGLVVMVSFVRSVSAQELVPLTLFYGEGCPHCEAEMEYLDELVNTDGQAQVEELEVYYDRDNNELMRQVAAELGVEVGGVPFLVVGDDYLVGFARGLSEDKIGQLVDECLVNGCEDVVAKVKNSGQEVGEEVVGDEVVERVVLEDTEETEIVLPFGMRLDAEQVSLPLITVVLALLDGFNPCAMWTLLFLISLLLGMKDRKRMWLLGLTFIVTSAGVYFLFLSAWLNFFLLVGYVTVVRWLIGALAVVAGGYYIWDYCQNRKGGCGVMGNEKRQRVFEQLKKVTLMKQLPVALVGIFLLAIAVNMVELVCSAGLPAVYTQVLALSDLPLWQYYGYLASYVLIFMLDDIGVFVVAMVTLSAVGVESKYARYARLVGGVVMGIIGLLLWFRPEWLMVG
jgi:thiol-disulfide isomerase/thioredoxin